MFITKENLTRKLKEMVKQLPADTQKVVEKIPGLEDVCKILQKVDIQYRFEENDATGIRLLASVLRVALDFDYYEETGHERAIILQTLKSRTKDYDPNVTDALQKLMNLVEQNFRLEEIQFKHLQNGMRLAEDLKS